MAPSSVARDLAPALLSHVLPPPATLALLEAALGDLAEHLVAGVPGVDEATVVLTGPLTLPVEERTARLVAASGGAGAAVAAATADSWLGPCVTAMVGLEQVVAPRPAVGSA